MQILHSTPNIANRCITIRTSILATYQLHTHPRGVCTSSLLLLLRVRARTRQARHLRHPLKETHTPSWAPASAILFLSDCWNVCPRCPPCLTWSWTCWAYDKPPLEKSGTKHSFLSEIQPQSQPATCAHWQAEVPLRGEEACRPLVTVFDKGKPYWWMWWALKCCHGKAWVCPAYRDLTSHNLGTWEMEGKGRIHNRLITQGQLEQARQLHPLPWHVHADPSEKDYRCSFF